MEPATIEAQPSEYPLLIDRVQSAFIDAIFILILMFCFAALLDKIEDPPVWIKIVLFFGLFAIYEPLCITLGGTLGNHIKHIRVRQAEDTARKINFPQAFVRYLIKMLLGWLSFLTIHFNRERRAIHDFAAQSIMIKIDRLQ